MVRKPSEWLKIVKEYHISNISMTRLAEERIVVVLRDSPLRYKDNLVLKNDII